MNTPAGSDQLFERLRQLDIVTSTVSHEPVLTVEQAKEHRGDLTGTHIKNLFLRNKKRMMWLVVALEDRLINLKALAKRLEAGNLSFGSPDRLMQYLGVVPGAVTPFALINDRESVVRVVFDATVLECDPIQCHPLRSDMTTAIGGADLMAFARACGHEPLLLDFDS